MYWNFTGDGKLEGIHFKSTKTGEEHRVSCDGVFEYIGLKPTTEFCESLGVLDQMGYVKAGSHMETEIPGIFGAGDCTAKHLRQVITACGTARSRRRKLPVILRAWSSLQIKSQG